MDRAVAETGVLRDASSTTGRHVQSLRPGRDGDLANMIVTYKDYDA
jgi:hypothetical protein